MKALGKIGVTLCLGSLLALHPEAARAGDVADEPARDLTELSPEQLMTIEVATVYSASKFEQKVTEAPSSVSIVTSEEIKRYGYRTLADILRSLRSFTITYDRNYNYVGVRGFGRSGDYNTRILLLVDGHRINDDVYDSAAVGTEFPLDVDLIERVEVIRGPGSSLYGNNAFFAVVDVVTRNGADLNGAELSGAAASFDTYKGRASYGKVQGQGIEYLLSASVYDSSGNRLFFPEFNDAEHNFGVTNHTDYDRSHSFFLKTGYADLVLEGAYSSRTKGIPTASFGTDFNDSRNRTVDSWGFVDLKYRRHLGSGADLSGRLFYDHYVYDGDYVYGGRLNKDRTLGGWWGGEVKLAAQPLDRHKLIVGVEYQDNFRQDQKNFDEDPFTMNLDDRSSSTIWAGYLQDEFSIVEGILLLNAGVRYDHYSSFGSTVNPRLGLIYHPFGQTTFKLLYGSAFRAPNAYELHYLGPGQAANPNLNPEKIKTYEAICEQYLGNGLRGTVTGFYYEINDLIVQVEEASVGSDGEPATVSIFRNLDKARAAGFETELEGKWENGLLGRVSYSYQDAWDAATHQPLVNSARHLAKLNLSIPLLREKLFLGIEEQFASRRKTLADNYAKSYYVTNLTLLSRDLIENLELSASLYNLFDYHYGDPGGSEHVEDTIRQDGRTFRVKLTYRF